MVWACFAGGVLSFLALLLGVRDVPVSSAVMFMVSAALMDRGLRQVALRRSAGDVLVDCGPHASPGWLPFLVGVTALLAFRTGTMFGDDPGGRIGRHDVQEIAVQVILLGCLWASHLDGLRVRAAGVTGNLRCVPWSRVAAYQIVERSGHCELLLSWRGGQRAWCARRRARVSQFDISPQHRAAVESVLREKVGPA
jgi:hypothetical protein